MGSYGVCWLEDSVLWRMLVASFSSSAGDLLAPLSHLRVSRFLEFVEETMLYHYMPWALLAVYYDISPLHSFRVSPYLPVDL